MKIIAVILTVAVLISDGKTASRELLSVEDDLNRASEAAKDGIEDFFTSIWGKICLMDDNCIKVVAYCERVEGGLGIIGQCRPNVGVWLVLAVIAIILLICCCVCRLCWRPC